MRLIIEAVIRWLRKLFNRPDQRPSPLKELKTWQT
jgi:hypothetical protein